MFDPMIHSSDGIVLPALEAAYMVTAVKEAEDGTAQLCPSQADSPSTPSYLSAPLPRHIHNSSWRAGRILSWFVPPLLGLFILYGWQFASRFVIPYVCETHTTLVCKSYSVTLHILLTFTLGLFIFLWIAPNYHSAPPSSLPQAIQDRLIPHQVTSSEGGYNECWQDDCAGRVLPPRARHCKDCKKCRLDFDHHCPWLGCISRDTVKSFILFLGVATTAILVGLLPVYGLAWRQLRLVTSLTWEEEWMYREWWDVKWTWICGPITRYVGAVIISYLYYDFPIQELEGGVTGTVSISATLLFYSFYGTILGFFCVLLCLNAMKDVATAGSTIESTRTSRRSKAGVKHLYSYRYIQMPLLTGQNISEDKLEPSAVKEIPTDINLYHFGVVENLKRVFGRTVREWASPWPPSVESTEHWRIGPKALQYLEMPTDQRETNRKFD